VLPLHDNVPTRRFPVVTVGLIAANLLVWLLYQEPDFDRSVRELAFQPCEIQNTCPQVGEDWWLTWFTAVFLHAGWGHILGNMLFLWIFGNNVEDAMGRVGFLAFYILGGIAATATQTVATLATGTLADAAIPVLGASGAISAVLGAYLVLLPRARVLTLVLIFPIHIRAMWFIGIWFFFQLLSGNAALAHPEASGGVAFFAHIGGFLFGALTVRAFVQRPPLQPAV
jgi:membrane associated rhomboid family serine protease